MTSVMNKYPAVVRNPELQIAWITLENGVQSMMEVRKGTESWTDRAGKVYPVTWKPNDLFTDTFEFAGIQGHSGRTSNWSGWFKSCSSGECYRVTSSEFSRIILRNSLAMGTLSGYWFFSRAGSIWHLNFSHSL